MRIAVVLMWWEWLAEPDIVGVFDDEEKAKAALDYVLKTQAIGDRGCVEWYTLNEPQKF